MTDRRSVLLLAAFAGCDPLTAKKAIEGGVSAVRGWSLRHRLADGAAELGITLGTNNAKPADVVHLRVVRGDEAKR